MKVTISREIMDESELILIIRIVGPKGSSGEFTINYTSRFNVIAYIDSKHYIKSLTRPN